MGVIVEFQGEYRWLSNFASVQVEFEGRTYPSVEHAYVAAKSLDEKFRKACTNPMVTSAQAKAMGKEVELRGDWDEVKDVIMYVLLKSKFSQEPFRTKLMETKNDYIQEGNWWGDKYWGYCLKTNEGENHLGKLIMQVRYELLNFLKKD